MLSPLSATPESPSQAPEELEDPEDKDEDKDQGLACEGRRTEIDDSPIEDEDPEDL